MKAVNLIPSDDRGGAGITAGRSGGGVFVIAGLLSGLAILALLYGLADHQISSNRSEVASLTVRAQQAQTHAGELSPYTSFLQMREQRVQAVTTLVDSRFDWAQAFQELGRVLPAGKVSLGSIEGTVGSTGAAATPASGSASAAASGSSVTPATPPGSIPVFKLTGCAVSQSEVALMLERLRLIDGVSEVTLQSSTQAGASGSGAGGGCAGGNPAFMAQVTFDPLPAIPTSGTGTGTSTATSSTSPATSSGATATSATTPASVPAASAPASSSAPASNAAGAKAPVGSAASASSSGAVR